MNWKTVKIQNDRKGRTLPYASVGFGRISLSSAACDLIKNSDTFSYVELLEGQEYGRKVFGVRFLKEYVKSEDSLPIKRRTVKGKIVGGIDICNKGTVEALFGKVGVDRHATRFNVRKDPDDPFVLIIEGE